MMKRMNVVENKLKLLALLCAGSLLLSACGGGEPEAKAEGQTQEQSQNEEDSSEDSGSVDEKQTRSV
jgi:starvation-inducible outer membrane lipoprotein